MSKGNNHKQKPKERAPRTGLGAGESDDDLWLKVTETVKPLKSNKITPNRIISPENSDYIDSAPKRTKKYKAAHPNTVTEPRKKTHELTHGAAPGVDKRTNQRLIRGKLPIEGRLDLHGHTRETAHRALEAFINGSFSAGKRCVIVITGKGLRLETGDIGVLRQAVPQWLNGPALRSKVLAYSHATPKDGGEGALYVLLKRKR